MVGIGGTIRTLAAMHQRRTLRARRDPRLPPQPRRHRGADRGHGRAAGARSRPAAGLKHDRADITLAGATVISTALEHLGVDGIEICAQGLREGIFYERFLAPADPPLIGDVRRQSVLNLVDIYRGERPTPSMSPSSRWPCTTSAWLGIGPWSTRRARAALGGRDAARRGRDGRLQRPPQARVLPRAERRAAGFGHRELALVALLVRAHRKALPATRALEGVLDADDDDRLMRLAACLRLAEQLERGRAGGIRQVRIEAPDGTVRLAVQAEGDPAVALWSAALEAPTFQRAFGRRLELTVDERLAAGGHHAVAAARCSTIRARWSPWISTVPAFTAPPEPHMRFSSPRPRGGPRAGARSRASRSCRGAPTTCG